MAQETESTETENATGNQGITKAERDSAKRCPHYLGTSHAPLRDMFFKQAVRAICGPDERKDEDLSPVYEYFKQSQAENPLEAMLHMQMFALHVHAMTMMHDAQRVSSIDLREKYLATANRLTRTFSKSLEALGKYQRQGQQTIRVETVVVQEGGQAIVGNVTKTNNQP